VASKRRAKEEARPASAPQSEVKVQPAKGRPMLQWVGKRPLTRVPAYPAQHIETFDPTESLGKPPVAPALWRDWPSDYPRGGLLFHGDNQEVLAHLLANGYRSKVKLIYIDPPFDSGADYVRQIRLRGERSGPLYAGEGQSIGEQVQYPDLWANDGYLQFMYERLLLLKELLSPDGLIVVHLDETRVHYLKVILDEVFGREHFINEVIWKRQTAHSDIGQGARHLGRLHDSLLLYSKGDDFTWNDVFTPYSEDYADSFYRHADPDGRRYTLSDATAPGGAGKGNPYYEFLGVTRYWRFSEQRMKELYEEGRIVQARPGAVPRQKRYLDEMRGVPLQSIWDDVKPIQSQAHERTDYPTQKPETLLQRILSLTTAPGDLVLDCFIGSGTAAAVAQKVGRRWIGCDINRGAVQTTVKRLQAVVREQMESSRLIDDDETPATAQLGFTVWRVNDYDLQIQHNEAVNLACDFIGVERLRSDGFFDGTFGKSLVKVVPFNHPLTPLDLEEVKRELDARPDEDRTVTLVSLGIEIGAQAWIDEWNRMRRGKDAVNRVEVIELRTDPRYGGVIRHEPARAKVKVQRAKGRLHIEIEDFVSPTIIQRLQQQSGLLNPQVDDWRAMVDSISIDPAYDGEVLNIAIADVPERKSDLVSGMYDLEAPEGETTVAVKIIDMLGEEVLVTERV